MGLYAPWQFTDALFLLYGNPGIISYLLFKPGKLIKNGGFTSIGVSNKRYLNLFAHRGESSIISNSIKLATERLMAIWVPLQLI